MQIEMRQRECPLCAGTRGNKLFAEKNFDLQKLNSFGFASRKLPEYMHYKLVSCGTCDVLFAAEIPVESFLSTSYHQASFDSAPEALLASKTYAEILKTFDFKLPDKAGALDIGTGDGVFLERLIDSGYLEVRGVEPSQAPVDSSKPEIKKLIKVGFFSTENYSTKSFSLVTCFQTLEHVSDPLGLCKSASSLLKQGGCAFFVVHNRRAFSAKILGRKSPIFDIEHLQLFSKQSARFLLESAGLKDVKVQVIYNRYPISYWIKLFPFPLPLKSLLLKLSKLTGFGRIMFKIPAGNIALYGFKRD